MNAAICAAIDPDTAPMVSPASIDDLDAAICQLTTQMNAVDFRLLLLVREFDDRFGWAKWSFASCAECLAWRCGIGLSAAREKVRESVEDARRAWQRRRLSVIRNAAHGTLTISVELPVEDGEVIVQALEKAVRSGEVANGPEFEDSDWHTQQAYALVALAKC